MAAKKNTNVTYKHKSGKTVTYSAPHPTLERAKSWSRVDKDKPSDSGSAEPNA